MAETQHLLAGIQVTPEIFQQISDTTKRLEDHDNLMQAREEIQAAHDDDPAMLLIFGEASSRTKLSFVRSAMALRIPHHTETNARQTLSLAKNETIADTAKTINALGFNLIVFRSDIQGEVA